MNEQAWQQWFEAIWAHREEHLYREFFGDTGPGIYTIPAATFASLGVADPDPRFLTHGVFECPPIDGGVGGGRDHWLYVSSGMSNPWGENPDTIDPNHYSGLGYEFTIHARERGRWPILLLHWLMAVQLLVAAGGGGGGGEGEEGSQGKVKGELLQRNDRIALGGSLAKKEGLLTHIIVTSPQEMGLPGAPASPHQPAYPAEFPLASGRVDLLLILGITQREADFARTQGAEGLITLLHHHGIFPFTDPARQSAV